MSKADQNAFFTRHAIKNVKETVVWQELTPDIDPVKWAFLCRILGSMDTALFSVVYQRVLDLRKSWNQCQGPM